MAGAAYLHNATDPSAIADLTALPASATGRLFTGATRGEFIDFLRSRLAPASGAASADTLLRSAIAPSRQLLKVAADEVRDRERFHLLGDQQAAVQTVHHAVRQAHAANGKRIVMVTGGPGSGKSVIALSLLGELSREGRSVLHATGSRLFTQTLRKVAGHCSTRVKAMFKYFNQFMTAGANNLDVLILDEAHRIRETSVDRYTRAELRTSRPQLDELIAAARVPVFLLDENQVVRPGEMGTRQQIEEYASALGITSHHIHLDEQFRCGGSEEYVFWVNRLLGLRDDAPSSWTGDDYFDVMAADTPAEMEAILRTKMADGDSARITAGYCWPWSDARKDGTLVDDVVIDDWARPWNSKSHRRIGDAPPAPLWATEDGGFDQVGCIYTAQGFEYDWSGVIIGPDLVWRDGRSISVRRANRDPDFKNPARVSDDRFDQLVRNVYKVLLTRGMKAASFTPLTREREKHCTTS